MSNSEKIVYNPSEDEPKQGGLFPTASSQGNFPPPPTQPPASTEQQDSSLPPAYQQGDFTAPVSEKQQQQQAPPVTQTQQGEFAPAGSEKKAFPDEKSFPPPPPGPPPSQAHPNPLNVHPAYPAPPADQNYSIPAYNPANPVFAPPPANAPSDSAPPLTPVLETDSETAPAPAPAPGVSAATTTTHVEEQQHPHKKGWSERFSSLGIKAAAPINSLAHMLGSQSFLPETLDKECDKAASILRAFCKKGVYADPSASGPPTSTDPKATETNETIIDPTKNKPKNRVIVTIPPKVISKAVGLAIFTTLRAGFNVSGATGSGILVARLPDGSWGPPSGIQVHSVGGGFSIGLDIYDCVCVINSQEALAAFTKTRVGLGTDLAVVAGPYGAGGAVEFGKAVENREGRKGKETEPVEPADKQTLKPETDGKNKRRSLSASGFKPVFSYVKSRGFYAGIQIDGTVVVERKDANAAFYGSRVTVNQILKGEVPPQGPSGMWPAGSRVLLDTLKGAEAGMLRDKSPAAPGGAPAGGPATTRVPESGTEQPPPAYVDDGVHRPEVADVKYK
ncbi:hypothetical protein EDB81DRAFT_647652 [Dactylonectria macrodidyma]|uniref:Ysc84 actin-binding domain-containing protein n=1 Tax=Dactylonectria macrodidyma TaxID=307937 RepID=A0A9P9F5Q5_9HYPO|nr:hypothetical protein EDB81DRAFT_647652 [Dactylonectria macrodidyma]